MPVTAHQVCQAEQLIGPAPHEVVEIIHRSSAKVSHVIDTGGRGGVYRRGHPFPDLRAAGRFTPARRTRGAAGPGGM
ncbi:hypothetical protein Vau01_079470 [Virgisporangium aurantiacum]|uniref:Uncharacterized protein n=1 Tax=Virgisporangium aurantiacum TaxID=175570 RepID=A0A8J4E3S6_9ACTN|nr:hypothetical protein Vau01_079470 [Virgisporangium aurantiacum]